MASSAPSGVILANETDTALGLPCGKRLFCVANRYDHISVEVSTAQELVEVCVPVLIVIPDGPFAGTIHGLCRHEGEAVTSAWDPDTDSAVYSMIGKVLLWWELHGNVCREVKP